MNKVFLGLILTVCMLGMALVMLNDRLGRKPEPRSSQPVAEMIKSPARSPEDVAAQARAMELAKSALEPPVSGEAPAQPEAGRVEKLPEQAPMPARVEQKQELAKPQPKPELAARSEQKPVEQAPEPRPAPKQPQEQAAKPEPKPAAEQTKPAAAAQAAKEPAGSRTATRFVIYARTGGATVRIGGDGKVEYSSMTLENPNRVVVDLAGDWKFPPNPGIPKNDLVSAVRVGQNGDKTRMVIDLKAKPRKVLLVPFKGGDGVDVRVDK